MSFVILRVAVIFVLWISTASGRTSSLRGEANHVGDGVEADAVRASLQEALASVLALGGGNATERLKHIEDSLLPTFLSLPKMPNGRVGHRAVQYLVKSFFTKEHGWTLNTADGGEHVSKGLLQAKVPELLEAVLEAKQHGQGLSIEEVAALVAALERLILDESVQLLNTAYRLNSFQDSDLLNEYQLEEVLVSYLALFATANKNFSSSAEDHRRWKQRLVASGRFRDERSFAEDSIYNFDFARQDSLSPFQQVKYTFDTSGRIVDRMASQYGRWQDESCKVMRDALEAKDFTGTGRVSVEDFHSIKNIPHFNLNEAVPQLRKLGVLDESTPGRPMVRMANYITSPGNCGSFSNYYHVCCINNCMSIMNSLEGQFKAPTVAPELLLQALENMTVTGDKEFNIAASPLLGESGPVLRKRLAAIAQRHDGLVPLHGRLFETWLHFAFPRDCPLPNKNAPISNQSELTADALKEVAPQQWASEMDVHLPAEESQWNEDDESLPMLEEVLATTVSEPSSWIRTLLRLLAMTGACVGFYNVSREGLEIGRAANAMPPSTFDFPIVHWAKKKNDDMVLPMVF